MMANRLKEYLDSQHVAYSSIRHAAASTTQRIAAMSHTPGKQMAKTVMIKVDGKMAMAVLPATRHIDFEKLREVTHAQNIELANEMAFINMFPDCEPGAMPPFGNLYGMDVYVAESLTEDPEIAFNAGTHTELIRLSYRDYAELVRPKVGKFSC